MKMALGQINSTVGDFDGNLHRMIDCVEQASAAGARVIVFPELATCGYPPLDLLDYPDFLQADRDCLQALLPYSQTIAIVLGHVDVNPAPIGKPLCNAVSFLADGKVLARHLKALLPTYDVFDERRYFEPKREVVVVEFEGIKFGLSVCEDAWNDADFWPERLYDYDPIRALSDAGAQVLINVSASPFYADKPELRFGMLAFQAQKYGMPILHVNQVGGNDELVFDGHSMFIDGKGHFVVAAKGFAEDLVLVDSDAKGGGGFPALSDDEEVLQALLLGVRDYFRKTGFSKALVGLSGGIDSAVVAVLAAMALGPEQVLCLGMPSQYSSVGSIDDSRALATALGIEFQVIPIQGIVDSYLTELKSAFEGTTSGVAEENLQARARGNLLMAMSNKFGHLLLSTGNKSELAVGYCTLYGDMSGGLSVIGDLLKTRVYALARYLNDEHVMGIPEAILSKEPSAELRPDQKDSDSLPPYEQLDDILARYLEHCESEEDIVSSGHDAVIVKRVIRMVKRSEYKRRQSAPTLKLSGKAFGAGRRMPLAWHIE